MRMSSILVAHAALAAATALLASATALIAGCGSSSSDGGWTRAEPVAVSTPQGDAPAEPVARPRIDVDALLEYEGPAPTSGLPARAGHEVALPVVDNDTARGNPNLTLRIVDARSGDVVWEKTVLTPEEFAQAESPEALRELVEPRASAAQARLDQGEFEPLTAIYVAETPGDGDVEAETGGIVLRWSPASRVLLARAEDDDSLLARREVEPAPPTEPREACPEAHAPRLRGAWVDTPDGVLVARIAFVGNDACWEPPDRWLVIQLGVGTEAEQPPPDRNGA